MPVVISQLRLLWQERMLSKLFADLLDWHRDFLVEASVAARRSALETNKTKCTHPYAHTLFTYRYTVRYEYHIRYLQFLYDILYSSVRVLGIEFKRFFIYLQHHCS